MAGQCLEINAKVGYIPELVVMHNANSSIGAKLSIERYNYQKEAYKYLRKKYKKLFI